MQAIDFRFSGGFKGGRGEHQLMRCKGDTTYVNELKAALRVVQLFVVFV